MRGRLFLIPGLLLTLAAAASGQTKITGTLSCGKPDATYSIDVGDRTGHSVSISKFACTWTTPMEYGQVQAKDGHDVAYGDSSGAKVRSSGYHVSNLSNGHKKLPRVHGATPAVPASSRASKAGHLQGQSRRQRQYGLRR